jgi:hypothetical protein
VRMLSCASRYVCDRSAHQVNEAATAEVASTPREVALDRPDFTAQELQLFVDMGVDSLAQGALALMLKSNFAERQEQVRNPVSEDRTSERASNERLLWQGTHTYTHPTSSFGAV